MPFWTKALHYRTREKSNTDKDHPLQKEWRGNLKTYLYLLDKNDNQELTS